MVVAEADVGTVVAVAVVVVELLPPGTAAVVAVVVGLLLLGTAAAAVVVGGPPAGIVELEVEEVHLETVEVVHLGTVLAGVLVLGIGLEPVDVAGAPDLGIAVGVAAVEIGLAGVEVEGGLPGTGPVEPHLVDTAEG